MKNGRRTREAGARRQERAQPPSGRAAKVEGCPRWISTAGNRSERGTAPAWTGGYPYSALQDAQELETVSPTASRLRRETLSSVSLSVWR